MRHKAPAPYNIIKCLLALCLSANLPPASAAVPDGLHRRGWYAGVQAGMPFAVATFSSFGADKTRAGYAFGVYGGYRLGPLLSVEAQAAWGKAAMSARQCCVNSGYWLGADGNRYLAPVAGMDGHDYADLKSGVATQSYGARLNVNVLALFNSTRYSRWTLDVSPRLAAVATKAKITATGGAAAMRDATRWHLGAGADITAACAVTRNLAVGIYSGVTALTGKPVDGMPRRWHDSNLVWESGVRIGWTFGGKEGRR